MASRGRLGAGAFALGVALRATIVGALAFAAFLCLQRGLWASAAVAGVIGLLVAVDIVRSVSAADRVLAQFVEGVTAEGYERPATQPGLGEVARAIESALDRLARTRAERQRRIDHLEALLDNVAAALLVLDADGMIVSANRAAGQGLGATPGPIAAVASITGETASRLRTLPPGAREIVRLADGRAMLAQVALFTAERRALRLVSMQSLSGDLDAVELKAWQDLVRVLAHEMMNSLTPVSSLSDSLARRLRSGDITPAETAETVEVIARRSGGLMHFVDRYRRVTDLPHAELSRLKAADLVRDLDALMRPAMAEAAVDYESRLHPKALVLQADPDLIEQAMINLLKNALEAVRGRKGAAVRLAVGVQEAEAALVVEDNGPGLPEGDPEAAFVPFYTTKAGGSGIGLTLARQIALAHGGRLEYAPRPGGGAVFRFCLPMN